MYAAPDTKPLPNMHLAVPTFVTLVNTDILGTVQVKFEGREVGGSLRARIKTAFAVLTGRATRLYAANTHIHGCHIHPRHLNGPVVEVG